MAVGGRGELLRAYVRDGSKGVEGVQLEAVAVGARYMPSRAIWRCLRSGACRHGQGFHAASRSLASRSLRSTAARTSS